MVTAQLRVGTARHTKPLPTTLVVHTFNILDDVNMMNSPKDIGEG
jgi:hypothetical protein